MSNVKNNIGFLKKEDVEIVEGNSVHSFPIHTHQVFCIGVITQGSLKFIINDREYCLREHSIYLVPPNKSHSIMVIGHHQYSYLTICIRGLFPQTNFLNYTCEDRTAAKRIIKLSEDFKRTKDVRSLKEGLVSILASLFEYDDNLSFKYENDIIDKAAAYIKNNLDKPFDLKALAVNVNISRFYLSRLFKK